MLGRWCCHNRCFYKVLGQWCCQNRCFYKVLGGVFTIVVFCQGFEEVVSPETVSILGPLLHFASWGPGGWATGWATGWAGTLRYATLSITYSIYIYIYKDMHAISYWG